MCILRSNNLYSSSTFVRLNVLVHLVLTLLKIYDFSMFPQCHPFPWIQERVLVSEKSWIHVLECIFDLAHNCNLGQGLNGHIGVVSHTMNPWHEGCVIFLNMDIHSNPNSLKDGHPACGEGHQFMSHLAPMQSNIGCQCSNDDLLEVQRCSTLQELLHGQEEWVAIPILHNYTWMGTHKVVSTTIALFQFMLMNWPPRTTFLTLLVTCL